MLTITNKSIVPHGPSGFQATVPQTKRTFAHRDINQLYAMIHSYCKANGLPIPDMQTIDSWVCAEQPHACSDGVLNQPQAQPELHMDLLTRVAAATAIPLANVLSKASQALGVNCANCSKRHAVIKKINEIGFTQAVKQIMETFK
jgi:hypothetical protein